MTDKEMPELKPCPFCGGIPRLYEDTADSVGSIAADGGHYVGTCSSKCRVRFGGYFRSEQAAIEAWNTRTDLVDELKAENERIKAEKQKMMACIETHTIDGAKTTQCYAPVPIIEQQASEITRLKKRLEIDPDHGYDGISCRDTTIKQQDVEIDKCHKKLAELRAELSKINRKCRNQRQSLKDLQKAHDQHATEIEKLKGYIKDLEYELYIVSKSRAANLDKQAGLEKTIENLEEQLEQTKVAKKVMSRRSETLKKL